MPLHFSGTYILHVYDCLKCTENLYQVHDGFGVWYTVGGVTETS